MEAIALRARCWLRGRWGTALSLVVVVGVVGGIGLALLAGAVRTATVVERKLDSIPFQPDVELEQHAGPPDAEGLEELPAVERAEVATFFFGALTPVGELAPADGIVFVGSSLEPLTIEGLLEGRMPSGEDPGEFVATPSYVANLGAEIGDQFDLITISQEQADQFGFDAPPDDLGGPVVPATLVGIIDEGVAALEDDFPVGFFDLSLLDEGDIGLSGGAGVVDLAPGATIDDLRSQLDERGDGEAFGLAPTALIDDDVRTAVDAQAQGVLVLAAIVCGAAIVVLGQILGRQFRLADDERTVLRSMGFTPAQLTGDPLVRAVLVVGLGMLLALVLAFLASGVFPVGFSRQVEPHPGLRFDPLAHVVGAVLFVVLVLGVVTLLLAGPRRTTVEPRPSTLVDRVVATVPNARVGTAVRFAFGRGPRAGSTITSLAGLVLVMTLVVAALTFGSNLDRLIEEPARYGDIFDVVTGQGGDSVPDGVLETIVGSPDVSSVMLYGATTVSVGSESFGIVAYEPVQGDVVPEVLDGRLPQNDDEMALGVHTADRFEVDVGDELEVSFGDDDIAFRIVGIAIVGSIEESDVAGQNGLVTSEGLQRIDPEDAMSAVGVKFDPDAPPGAQDRLAEELGLAIGPIDRPANVVNLSRVRGVPFAIAALVGLLAVLTLGHLMLVAVRRRGRDFAVLRACGATSRWVGGVVHWQASITTVLALLVAVPLGVAAGAVLYRPYAEGIGARTDATVPFAWLATGLVVLVVVANVAAAVPAGRIRRARPADVLTRP